jgi:hypothetical protein
VQAALNLQNMVVILRKSAARNDAGFVRNNAAGFSASCGAAA